MKRIAVAAVTAIVLGLLAAPSTAYAGPSLAADRGSIALAAPAGEDNNAVLDPSNDGPPVGPCIDITDAQFRLAGIACFEPPGDLLWAYDARADGSSVIAEWENYLRDPSGNWRLYRQGQCHNTLSSGHWGYCNKDFYEDSTSPNALGGQGSGLRIYACGSKLGCTGEYVWVRNSS